jgi:hypothetical protein
MRWILVIPLALAGCGASSSAADAGQDAGADAGPPPVTDGGALGAPCTSLDQCAGNLICALNQECPIAVICAAGQCASAGGPATPLSVALTVTASKVPSYVQLYALAPEQVATPTKLDCPGLLAGIDAGTLNPFLTTQVNPLLQSYAQNTEGAMKGTPYDFTLEPTASGAGRVLYLQGFLRSALADGGDALVGAGCAGFSDQPGDAGSVGITLDGP